ncbi:MAG: iron-containing alcohol dehydrogenase, partial [Lachnospiraceae bacterium]|nr:iron-containing alcohol dehydrogenase [Lachnospiraceae bacterium]
MKFYMPVRLFDEEDCVIKHAKDIAALGHKALIVTGKNSARKCGALDDVEAALGQEELDYLIFSDVEENPSVETVLFAGEKYGAEN